jgi:hypothetical protein
VEFVSSLGLGKLLSLSKKVRESGGQLSLRNVRPQVYEVLVMTRLTEIMDVQPATSSFSRDAAKLALGFRWHEGSNSCGDMPRMESMPARSQVESASSRIDLPSTGSSAGKCPAGRSPFLLHGQGQHRPPR